MQKRTTKPQAAHPADIALCTTVAVDLAKQVFQIAGEDGCGKLVYEKRIQSREAFSTFLGLLAKGATVLLETGPGAQAWARQVQALGCQVRLLPAQRVAEHRSGAKNDRNDAQAILRAGRDSANCAPSAARRRAQAAPTPLPAPVMGTVRPFTAGTPCGCVHRSCGTGG